MENIHENDVVALLVDRPDAGLQRGDIGTVIQVFESTPEHPAGLIVEFVDEDGRSPGSNRHYGHDSDRETAL